MNESLTGLEQHEGE